MAMDGSFPPSALIDEVAEIHRDIKGYYIRYGFMDNSKLDRFLNRVILPSLRVSRTHHHNSLASTAGAAAALPQPTQNGPRACEGAADAEGVAIVD
jgi:hypothetical protein